jgi:hypothetical protein
VSYILYTIPTSVASHPLPLLTSPSPRLANPPSHEDQTVEGCGIRSGQAGNVVLTGYHIFRGFFGGRTCAHHYDTLAGRRWYVLLVELARRYICGVFAAALAAAATAKILQYRCRYKYSIYLIRARRSRSRLQKRIRRLSGNRSSRLRAIRALQPPSS